MCKEPTLKGCLPCMPYFMLAMCKGTSSTVFAATFPVRIHVRLKLAPSFARFVTLLTGSHTIIMLVYM